MSKRVATRSAIAQDVGKSPHPGVVAIAVARTWFRKLCGEGTLPDKLAPVAVDPNDVVIAMNFLCDVKRIKALRSNAGMFSNDLAKTISEANGKPVSAGATIAAAVALGFPAVTWLGVKGFWPDALIGVGRRDVRRQMQR